MLPKVPPHKRIKLKNNPTSREVKHRGRIKRLPCFACGRMDGETNEAHHTMLPHPQKRGRRDHRFIAALCGECHRGKNGVHGLGSERLFNARNGTNLSERAWQEWEISNA